MKATIFLASALVLSACAKAPDASSDTTLPTAAATPAPAAGATTAVSSGEVQQASSLVDANDATQAQLVAAGIDSATAAALIAARPFADMVAFNKVLVGRNVPAERRIEIYRKVWKRIDLNTASKEEILLIPGVGNRMLREFEEYRPYKSIEQFRREIGKYVNPAELARLEQYVAVK